MVLAFVFWCVVLAGYSGTHPSSLAIALSSRSAGNYELKVADYASLGMRSNFVANQHSSLPVKTSL